MRFPPHFRDGTCFDVPRVCAVARPLSVSRNLLEMILFPRIVEFNYTDMATVIKQRNSGGHGKRHQNEIVSCDS